MTPTPAAAPQDTLEPKGMKSNATTNMLPLLNREDLVGKWAEQQGRPNEGESPRTDDQVAVVLCGVRHPSNVGSIMRSCSCFGAVRLQHLHYAFDETNRTYWSEPHVLAAVQSASVGTYQEFQQHDGTPFRSIPVYDFEMSEVPLVVLEAIKGAVSIQDYKFPERCEIMVGSEHKV